MTKIVTTLYLTRHGQTQWNIERKIQGTMDSPLTKLGLLQSKWLFDSFDLLNVDVVYSSPSGRAIQTAQIFKKKYEHLVVIPDDRLREIDMGVWEGCFDSDVERDYNADYRCFWETPQIYKPNNKGESFQQVQDRVISFIEEVVTHHEDKVILIITHAIALKVLMSYFEKRPLAQLWDPPRIEPTALCKVVAEERKYRIEKFADTTHFPRHYKLITNN